MARMLMAAGALLFLAGALLWAGGRLWPGLGRLPGDIAIQKGNWSFYFPLTTSLLVSLALTLLFWLLRRF